MVKGCDYRGRVGVMAVARICVGVMIRVMEFGVVRCYGLGKVNVRVIG